MDQNLTERSRMNIWRAGIYRILGCRQIFFQTFYCTTMGAAAAAPAGAGAAAALARLAVLR